MHIYYTFGYNSHWYFEQVFKIKAKSVRKTNLMSQVH